MKKWYAVLIALVLAGSVWADQLYLGNKPFRGSILGTGHDPAKLKIDLKSAVEALGLTLTEIDENWVVTVGNATATLPSGVKGKAKLYVAGKELPFTSDGDLKYVNLKEFGDLLGAKFRYNEAVQILDMNLVGTGEAGTQGLSWGGASAGYRLIFFGNDKKAPAAKHFRPILAQFEKDSKIPVVWVDTELPSSAVYKGFIKFFDGNMIPHTVLINSQEQVLKRWTGSIPIGKFAAEVKAKAK